MDEYLVPTQFGEDEFIEKKSRFIGRVWPVETEEDALSRIQEMKKQHYDATHNCWAYIIRDGAVRFSDDGEPGGTAGMPGSAMGAQVGMASNLLNLFLPEIQDQTIYQQVVQLRILAERGVITIIAKRLQRMQKEMQRGKLHRDDALSQIIEMAKKYNAYYLSAEELKHETETEAQIILSESFK